MKRIFFFDGIMLASVSRNSMHNLVFTVVFLLAAAVGVRSDIVLRTMRGAGRGVVVAGQKSFFRVVTSFFRYSLVV